MKKCKKLLAFTLSVLLAFACYVVPAFALSSASQYGLEATLVTDKESYKANEEIHVTVTVKNTNDFKVEAVSIESLLPETLTLKDGSNSTKTVDLEPGETLTLSFTAVKEKEETSATEPESQSTEPTETETVIPSESETVKPSESESVKPSETGTVKPSESETVKPSETETQKPTQESTEQPTQAPTTEQPTQGATTPIPTEPIAPATTTEETTLAPSTTGTQPTTGGIIGDLATTFPKTTTPADSSTTAQAENPDTGDSMSAKTLAIAIIALFSVIATVIILMYKYKKQTTQIISLVMCVAISASAITGVTFFTAKGVDDNRESFTVEKVITVDGEETNVSAEVKYKDDGNLSDIKLYSNPKELNTSDKPQEILFYIDTENKTSSYKVALIDSNTKEKVATLLDDGTNGDEKAGDGIYSGTIWMDCSEETTMQYYAAIDDGVTKIKSKVREVNIFAPMTDEEAENMKTVDNRLADLTESSEYVDASDDTKINLMKQELEAMLDEKLISDYQFANDNAMVSYTYLGGITAYWNIQQSENKYPYIGPVDILPSWNDLSKRYLSAFSQQEDKKEYFDEILFIYGWMDNYVDSEIANLALNLKKEGYLASSIYLPTIESYKTLLTEKNYKYIVIAEHGGENLSFLFFYDSTYIATQEKATKLLDEKYSQDLKGNNPRIIKQGGKYGIMPEFFSFYYENKLQNSIIDMQSCMGAGKGDIENYDFSSAFLNDCGASTYIGYHNSVYCTYTYSLTESILNSMLRENKNIGEAYVEAVDYWGNNDIDYMYRHGAKSDGWLQPDESGKTLKEKVQQKEKNGETAYPIMTGSAKTTLNATVKFAGGNGSMNDPYQISNAQQLDAVRYNLKSNFVLVNDIDLSKYNWEPIGGIKDIEAKDGFQGMFDGRGHTIKNLKMDYTLSSSDTDSGTTYQFGLFSNTQNSPGIKNVNLKDVDIKIQLGLMEHSNQDVEVGTIVAYGSEITNCTATGNIKVIDIYEVSSDVQIGGICKRAAQVTNCLSDVDIIYGKDNVTQYLHSKVSIGGIIAEAENVSSCINKGSIVCLSENVYDTFCGGIVGNGYNTVKQCKNYGNIDVTSNRDIYVGGVMGVSNKSIENCINYGQISARNYGGNTIEAGGIVGEFSGSNYDIDKIDKSVNCGNVTAISTNIYSSIGETLTGGIAGRVKGYSTISNCYNLSTSLLSRSQSQNGTILIPYIARVSNDSALLRNNYSLNTTTLNGSIPTEDIGPDQKNGGSMTKAEIEKAIQELGFELPGELPAAS